MKPQDATVQAEKREAKKDDTDGAFIPMDVLVAFGAIEQYEGDAFGHADWPKVVDHVKTRGQPKLETETLKRIEELPGNRKRNFDSYLKRFRDFASGIMVR
jgi:hypothetical protein